METAKQPLAMLEVIVDRSRLRPIPVAAPQGHHESESGLWSIARTLLLALLMAAPLLFGAVQPWAWGGLAIGVTCVLLLWGAGCVRTRSVTFLWSPLYLPLIGLIGLAAVQLRSGLSVDRLATREAEIKLVTYAILFFVVQQLYEAASAAAWQISAATVAVYVFLMALFAIVQFFVSPGLLYGVFQPPSIGVFGPYVNHGNYAGLMEMLIPVAMTLAISLRWSHPAKPFLLFVVFMALVSVFLSGSRAGLISVAIEFGIVGLVLMTTGSDQKHLLVIGMLAAALAFGFFYWLDPGDVWERWGEVASKPELAFGSRDAMAVDSWRMSRDHLAHGVGLGAFETAYTPYQTVVTELAIDYAHNDYVQFMAEAGIWAWILAPVSIGLFLVLSFRHLSLRLGGSSGWLEFGAAVGVCGLLVHSVSEFNLHIPANAAWFTVLGAWATLPATRLRHE